MLLGLFTNKICVFEGVKKSKTFWASVLLEVGAGEETGGCIMPPTLKMPQHKWECSLFLSAFLHNFTLVRCKLNRYASKGGLLNLVKFYLLI